MHLRRSERPSLQGHSHVSQHLMYNTWSVPLLACTKAPREGVIVVLCNKVRSRGHVRRKEGEWNALCNSKTQCSPLACIKVQAPGAPKRRALPREASHLIRSGTKAWRHVHTRYQIHTAPPIVQNTSDFAKPRAQTLQCQQTVLKIN